ncbi:DNA polymerase-3 subunit epsilon/exodeoxyribonuclease X [Nocardiopsis sp. Huas11]|uniref:3'-5' exonuclease n=1 Tax=Nocardiopsis sp. Huas11 TaxID=2183912 RepID=UPI000EAFC0BB|nr:3'-5' exonuclease [Nocardiopsis sp. Huas11]RKS07325.1 DNA polymerase-3 subunit epsilon/exodeoxyribonuclease X [Nocardiopsis sp. Huas11]
MNHRHWTTAPLVALDLEGTGAQDRGQEAILEIALVPLVDGSPDMNAAYDTLVHPGRPVPRRPWISPGLTDDTLQDAPRPEQIDDALVAQIRDRYLVGHNVGVDYKLLRLRHPGVAPAGLIDTLRLARSLNVPGPKGLGALVNRYQLGDRVNALVPDSRPHRALWDTVAAALVLVALAESASVRSLTDLVRAAGRDLPHEEPTLF